MLKEEEYRKPCARKPHARFDAGERGKVMNFPSDLLYIGNKL